MTAHECLEHAWLKGDVKDSENLEARIPSSRFTKVRDNVRKRYDAWPDPNPPLGRIANYSSLKKHHPLEYHIHDAMWDRHEALPRFVIKPYSTTCIEGQSATFYCRVIAAATPVVSWFRDDRELKQSVKFMKRYDNNDYSLTINRVSLEDEGEYVVRAKNSYGSKEETVFLQVQSKFILSIVGPSKSFGRNSIDIHSNANSA